MKKVTELKSEDFPNVIPEKFDEWKSIILKQNKASKILPFLQTGLLILLFFINGPTLFFKNCPIYVSIIILLAPFLLYVAYATPIALKANSLMKEMGITRADFKNAFSKKSTTENDNNIATTTVKSNESQPKQPRQTTDQQSLEPLLWENYCLFCDEYESGIGVCSKIHENVRSYPKKFINKCNGKFFKKI